MVRILVLLLLAAGCGGEDFEPEGEVCEAGRIEGCPCEDGSQGIQTCAGDGSAWGACDCNPGAGGGPSQVMPDLVDPDDVCEFNGVSTNPNDIQCPPPRRQFYPCDIPAGAALDNCVEWPLATGAPWYCCE